MLLSPWEVGLLDCPPRWPLAWRSPAPSTSDTAGSAPTVTVFLSSESLHATTANRRSETTAKVKATPLVVTNPRSSCRQRLPVSISDLGEGAPLYQYTLLRSVRSDGIQPRSRSVLANGAGVLAATADRSKLLPGRRRCPAVGVSTPADRRSIGLQPARIERATADGDKPFTGRRKNGYLAARRLCEQLSVAAPAYGGPIGVQCAHVLQPAVDGLEAMGRRMRLGCMYRQSELIEHTVMGDYFDDVFTWRDYRLCPVIPDVLVSCRIADSNILVYS